MDLYWIVKVLLRPILTPLFRPWVRGGHHVPQTGGAILASNHLSVSDSVFLALVLRRRVTFLAKKEYFTGPGIKGRLQKWFVTGVGQVPVDRSGGQASAAALDSGLRVLRRGQLLGLYPEGTRSPDGRLYRGKTGVARLALESRVPVIPIVMVGTDKVQPIGRTLPSLGRVGIIVGRPLDFSRYDGLSDDRYVLRSITDEIIYELMRLSGQEYVDEYAAAVKERIAAEKRQRVVTTVLDTVTEITGRDTSRLSSRLLGEHPATPDPAPDPAPESAPDPTADPTPGPAPDPTRDPTPGPTPDPGAQPAPDAGGAPPERP